MGAVAQIHIMGGTRMWRHPIYFEYTMPNGTSPDAFSAYGTFIGSSEDKYISLNHEDSGLGPGA